MDYFQGVVTEFLRADRAMFVNTECLLQLEPGNSPAKGEHWYCDAVAVDFRHSAAYLCEVTYSTTLHALIKRLRAWDQHWPALCAAISRDCFIPAGWEIRPWLFVPADRRAKLVDLLASIASPTAEQIRMPQPRVTSLEDVTPWKYHTWDRKPTGEAPGSEQ